MVELHMIFVPVDFIIMDMGKNTSSPIILGRPFLRTSGFVIDCKEGNVKFQFPHKSLWNTSLGRKKYVGMIYLMPLKSLKIFTREPSYMALKKAICGRQPICFCFYYLVTVVNIAS